MNRLINLILVFVAGCHAGQTSVLDLFPDTGVQDSGGKASCSFSYAPSGSTWVDGVHEEDVFLASIQSEG